MQVNEFNAILATTREFAIRPVPVSDEQGTKINAAPRVYGQKVYVCPVGLTRATILESGVKWIEKRVVTACGDQDYEIQRKNGVRVEFDLPGYEGADERLNQLPLTEIVERDGQKFVRQIISVKVVYSAWGEYALEAARREKVTAERDAKHKRLTDAQTALMGTRARLDGRLYCDWYENHERDEDGGLKRDESRNLIPAPDLGVVPITIEVAERIIGLLTRKQKAQLAESFSQDKPGDK